MSDLVILYLILIVGSLIGIIWQLRARKKAK